MASNSDKQIPDEAQEGYPSPEEVLLWFNTSEEPQQRPLRHRAPNYSILTSSGPLSPYPQAFPSLPEASTSITRSETSQTPSQDPSHQGSVPARRGRARSSTVVSGDNPLECPITSAEQSVAHLARVINHERRRASTVSLPSLVEGPRIEIVAPVEIAAQLETSPANSPFVEARGSALSSNRNAEGQQCQVTTSPFVATSDQLNAAQATTGTASAYRIYPSWEHLRNNTPSPRLFSDPTFEPQVRGPGIPLPPSEVSRSLQEVTGMMNNYPNYLDSPGAGPSPNPRQAPPSPSQGMHQNGMNGGMGLAGGMVGFPTPAGHQSDLNYIMQMVEELSGQLAHNQGLTAGIVDKMGKVRAKAKDLNLSNDELLAIAASELNISSENLEKENSELRKALEQAIYDKKENWKLVVHGANILADILEKMHKFKAQHETDTLAWHRNYRKQLADEREENLNLRCHINDMKAAACRANEHLRQMRRYLTDHDELHELRVQNIALRLERRSWKRMAMPYIPDDDSEWSDDDDLIDPEEKKRLAAEKAEKDRKNKEGEDDAAPGAAGIIA